jgi:hypothetical protein
MADFTIQPIPLRADPGIGFWIDLKALLVAASEILESNTRGADPSSDSSSGADIAYDPDVATVTELLTGIDTVISSLSDVV